MNRLQLLSPADLQEGLADYLHAQRKKQKLSRAALAERSGVPAPTLKKFELTGQISLRQFLLLWQCLDDLGRLQGLTQSVPEEKAEPKTIDEVLNS
ncbi:transcriptional regulator [Marinospirillum sp.]|uniref:transcriptional regulator n=1 Tax=Marinospirillum sp. TaxID=2183934 RepID=UPI00384B267B